MVAGAVEPHSRDLRCPRVFLFVKRPVRFALALTLLGVRFALALTLLGVLTSGCAVASTSSSRGSVVRPLGPGTITRGCRFRGSLPDSRCTPGSVLSASAFRVCEPGYARAVRNVSALEKLAVRRAYGVGPRHGSQEIDHLVALELGGANDRANLWPEPALPRPGFREKDALENLLHRRVCTGQMTLARAQRDMTRDWVAAWEKVGRPR